MNKLNASIGKTYTKFTKEFLNLNLFYKCLAIQNIIIGIILFYFIYQIIFKGVWKVWPNIMLT